MNVDSMCEHHVSTSKNQELVPSCERANLGSTSEGGSNDYIDKQELPSYVEYADKFADSIFVDEEAEKVEIVTKSTIIKKLDIEEITKDQLYKNKKVLKTALSLYAIKNNF